VPVDRDKVESLLERRRLIASGLLGVGTLAAAPFFVSRFSGLGFGEYQVIAEWQIPGGGKGMIIATRESSGLEQLRALVERFRQRFRGVDNVTVMIFDDAAAAAQVRRGSRHVSEPQFEAALAHQRAMYLKSLGRGQESLTIYDAYPAVSKIIEFDDGL